MDFYECPQCKNKIKNEHRESHELYCVNSIRQSEFENLIPCEICNNLIPFDNFMNHMENCNRQQTNIIPPPPTALLNLLNNFPPLNNQPPPEENDENTDSLNEANNENLNENENTDPGPNNSNINFFTLPLPPIDPNTDIQTQINNLLSNITNIDNLIGTQTNFTELLNLNNEELNIGDDYQNLTNLINQVGNVNVGIDDINKVTTIEVNTIDCPICGDQFDIVRRTACNHDFCFSCLNEWIKENNTCPICSTELKEF